MAATVARNERRAVLGLSAVIGFLSCFGLALGSRLQALGPNARVTLLSSAARLPPPRRLSASDKRSAPTIFRPRVCARPVRSMLGTPLDNQAASLSGAPSFSNVITAMAGRPEVETATD